MSDLERACFNCLEWAPDVVDTREQFPLLPRSATLEIAKELGLKHPADPRSKEPIVMTSDFLITISEQNGPRDVVVTVKPAQQLTRNVLVKFEIERRYWERQGIPWFTVSEKDIPLSLAQNVEFLSPYRNASELHPLKESDVQRVKEFFDNKFGQSSQESLRSIAQSCEDQLGYPRGTGLAVLRHLLANRVWDIDMLVLLDPVRPLAFSKGG